MIAFHAQPMYDAIADEQSRTHGRYGLPLQVQFCKRCVISNQRPNSAPEYAHTAQSMKRTINFTEGVCDACRVAEAKKATCWKDRERQLRALCDEYRSPSGAYDCIVPGSGGKDSFYAAHMLKTQYGMHPLTVTWAPHLYTEWGYRNWTRWLAAGFDNYLVTPNPQTHRLLTRLAVENLFHPFQPFVIGQKALAPKMAKLFNVPLVFYGENEAEYGNPIGDTLNAKRDPSYYASEDAHLSGVPIAELKSRFKLNDSDLAPYMPADDFAQVHYLGYYLKWHPQGA